MTELSIIIVTYENSGTIADCLRSIQNDCNQHITEIILIDNASCDETLSTVRLFQKTALLSVRIITNRENLGFARAVNQGISASSGEMLLILNPDTVIQPGFFKVMISWFAKNPDIGILAPQHRSPDGAIIHSCREFPTHLSIVFNVTGLSILFKRNRIFNGWKMGYFDHVSSRYIDQPMGACQLVRKEDVKRIGYMDEQFRMFFNDVDLCKRFSDAGLRSFFLSEAQITHVCGHSVRRHPVRMICESHVGFYRYFQKHFTGFAWLLPNLLAGILLTVSGVVRIVLSPFIAAMRPGRNSL